MVSIGGKSTQTDADGHYDLTGVPAGAQLLTAGKDGYVGHSGEVTVIAAETRVIDLRLVPTPGAPTEGPAGLSAESGSAAGQIHLTWSPITGAASYTLYWSTTPGVTPTSGTPIPGLQGPAYDHSGLTPGTVYYYVLTAVSEGSQGPSSTEVSATGANGITLKILDPSGGVVADTSIQATVVVNSVYQLVSVTATVEDRTVPLGFLTFPDRWHGIALLTGLPSPRQRTVTFTATDIHGSVGKASQSFEHNRRAVVTVQSPVPGAVAQPQIRVRASCQDDVERGCAALEALIPGFGEHIVGGINGIDQDISLAIFDGQPVTITFQATDDLGRSSFASVTVYADQSAHLVEVDEVTGVGAVVDASADQLLVVDTISQRDVYLGSLKIQNRATGLASTILTRRFLSVRGAHLTPHGAVLVANEEASNFSHLYEWRDHALLDLGIPVGVAIDEPYLAWGVFNGSLFRKDLQSGATITVPGVDGNALSDVGPNGDVVIRSADYEIRRFRDGVITTLVPADPDPNVINGEALTDGVNVCYSTRTQPAAGADMQFFHLLALTSAGLDTLVRFQIPPGETGPGSPICAVRAGWLAFTRPASGGAAQVWVRSPTGDLTQVSFFSGVSTVEELAEDGRVVFSNSAGSSERRRYLWTPGGAAVEISSGLGRPEFIEGQLHIMIGNALFMVN